MPKSKSPFPPIIPLKILINLYANNRNVFYYTVYGNEAEIRYMQALQTALVNDSISTKKSKNFIYKLIGKPISTKNREDDGISTSKLDALTLKVVASYHLHEMLKLEKGNEESPWGKFVEVFSDIQTNLQFKEKTYYKYLSEAEKAEVDSIVDEKVMEIMNSKV